jgi:hypothetical protein
MGVSGQHHAPAALYPRGKDPPVLIVQEAGWALEPVWTQRLEERSSAPVGNRTPVVQSVVRHYTAWATPAPPSNEVVYLVPNIHILFLYTFLFKIFSFLEFFRPKSCIGYITYIRSIALDQAFASYTGFMIVRYIRCGVISPTINLVLATWYDHQGHLLAKPADTT